MRAFISSCASTSFMAAREAFDDGVCAACGGIARAQGHVDATVTPAVNTDEAGPAGTPARDQWESAEAVGARSIGHTSYVLKLRLKGGLIAAYKPRSTLPLGGRRYRGEIAAYRLALALGIDNVPRALPRSFRAARLRSAFATKAGAQEFDRIALIDDDGSVQGALIPWIAQYEEVPLEAASWRAKWLAWLTDETTAIPEAERPLAGAISTMLAFDYLTGNWDRFSGGNVARDRATGTLLFVDNDGAFYDPPPAAALQSALAQIRRVARFSRSCVDSLRALTASRLRAAMGDEHPGRPLLSEAVLAEVQERRSTLLGVIDACIARSGQASVLSFR